MDILRPIRRFDAFQREHKALAVPIAVLKKFSDDGAGDAAALIAYWAFFSIFPLLLVFVTILGFVLQGDPSAQRSITDSVLTQFPVLGVHPGELRGSATALVIGLAGALLSGLGVTLAAQKAFNLVYAVPHKEQPDFLVARLRGLKVLAVAGLLQVASSIAAGLVSGGYGGVGTAVAGLAVSLALNLALFLAAFRLLTDDSVLTGELWTGVVLAAVGWTILQSVGGLYVAHVVKGSTATYGTFATVIGLLVWLYLGARIVVYAAEINVVVKRGLWPRSILDPPSQADRRARTALAKMEERDDRQTIDVTFGRPADGEPRAGTRPPGDHAPRGGSSG
jgi:membrane protein